MGHKAQVRRLTNIARKDRGARPLRGSKLLRLSAQAKARRLARTGELEHGTWWKLIDKYAGRRFDKRGENIAGGFKTAGAVVGAWMDSPTHRENIEEPSYTHIGVGRAVGRGRVYWVQHFGERAR